MVILKRIKSIILWIFYTAGITILSYYVPWCRFGVQNLGEIRTINNLKCVIVALRMLSDYDKGALIKELEKCKNPYEANRKLKEYIENLLLNCVYSDAQEKRQWASCIQEGILVDGWGYPLRVAVKGGPLKWEVLPKELQRRQIALWSTGKNHIDEWGHGDDVYINW